MNLSLEQVRDLIRILIRAKTPDNFQWLEEFMEVLDQAAADARNKDIVTEVTISINE
jgi:hypothetical protein